MQKLAIISLLFLFSCNSKDEAQQNENWILESKKVYTYKQNSVGLPDTIYSKIYTYQNLNVKDSAEVFIVNKFDGDKRLMSSLTYLKKKDSSDKLIAKAEYAYSGKYLVSLVEETNGIIRKNEKYVYDSVGRVMKSLIVRAKNDGDLLKESVTNVFQADAKPRLIYDTFNVVYKYDSTNKNIGGEFFDNRGNLVRRDVNIYSGTNPLASYNFGAKGDTLQQVKYDVIGKELISRSENDQFVRITSMNSGFTTQLLTIDKPTKKQIKQQWNYEQGQVSEERIYRLQEKN